MAIVVICGSCGKSVSAPDAAAGKKVKCFKCGSITPVSAIQPTAPAITKICTDCGIDVAGQKRTKDPAGQYFCQPCWTARASAQRNGAPKTKAGTARSIAVKAERPSLPAEALANPFSAADPTSEASSSVTTCPVCGRDVPTDDMTTDELGGAICWPCQNERNSPLELAALEPAAATSEPPVPIPPAIPIARNRAGGSSKEGEMTLLKKVAMLAGGVAMLGFFAVWPMVQVTERVPKISIWFKGILLGAMLTSISLANLVFGDSGFRWRRNKKEPLTAIQIVTICGSVLAGLALTGFVYYFFDSHGYKIKW